VTIRECALISAGRCLSWITSTTHPADSGNMQNSVNANGIVITSSQVTYNGSLTTSDLAQSLAGALPSNSYVTAGWNGDNSFTVTASSTGTSVFRESAPSALRPSR
jgi:hypothetical protein